MNLGAAGFERKTKRTHKQEFPVKMNLAIPWFELTAPVTPHALKRNATHESSTDADARHSRDDQTRLTKGADKAYDPQGFIEALQQMNLFAAHAAKEIGT